MPYTTVLTTLTGLASAVSAAITISGAGYAIFMWCSSVKKQSRDIAAIKEENALIVFALSACLECLMEPGQTEAVKSAKNKLDKYINTRAHQ